MQRVALYDRLFSAEVPGDATGEPFDDLNPDSRELLTDCKVEPALADTPPGSVVQFERLGYFAHDPTTPMLFHRTVGLRDEWANIQKAQLDVGKTEPMARGRLRVYLGAAPGVGKTHAMLEEGLRTSRSRRRCRDRRPRRATARPSIETLAAGLERVADLSGNAVDAELDVAALRQRRPHVVLVDNLAHRVDQDARTMGCRWKQLLRRRDRRDHDRQHLQPRIDGRHRRHDHRQRRRETVPDSVVRARRSDRAGRHEPGGAASPPRPRPRLPARPHRHRAGQPVSPGSARQAAPAQLAVARRPGRGADRATASPADVARRGRRRSRAGGRCARRPGRRPARAARGTHRRPHGRAPRRSARGQPGQGDRGQIWSANAGCSSAWAASTARSSATTLPRRSPSSPASSRRRSW